jgi:hypothetical protein
LLWACDACMEICNHEQIKLLICSRLDNGRAELGSAACEQEIVKVPGEARLVFALPVAQEHG